jgi:hypothetical protein
MVRNKTYGEKQSSSSDIFKPMGNLPKSSVLASRAIDMKAWGVVNIYTYRYHL